MTDNEAKEEKPEKKEPEEERSKDDLESLLKDLGITPIEQKPAQQEQRQIIREERPSVKRPELQEFAPAKLEKKELTIDALRDVSLNLKIELGRARMYIQDVLKLSPGSVIELDKLTGDPLDIYVNERLVARGEILIINDTFAIRVTEIISPAKKEKKQ
jgi:flagellar motor switch protein FliN/FliY